MADRPFIFRQSSKELVLPVTPESYRVEKGNNIEIVNIHELGDAVLVGYGILATIKVSCLLPANDYPFADSDDPEPYIDQFQKWIRQKRRLRFIVGGTGVNVPAVIENLQYGESDGTNDVYADITLREYRTLDPVQLTAPPTANSPRFVENEDRAGMQTHKIVYGDTLSALCRKYYGDGSQKMWEKLAVYNNQPNPHLVPLGTVLNFPNPLP